MRIHFMMHYVLHRLYISTGSLVDVEVSVMSDGLTAWTINNPRPDGECIINTTTKSGANSIRAGGMVRNFFRSSNTN